MIPTRLAVVCAAISVGMAVAAFAPSAVAQSVRGTVTDAGGTPVPGVLIQLIGADSAVAARTLTGARGEFLLGAPRAGTYRVRSLRIGYRPVLSAPVSLAAGQEVAQQVQVVAIALGLDTVRVGGRNACGTAAYAGGSALALWEQARAAITATAISAADRSVTARRVTHEVLLDAAGFRPLQRAASVETQPTAQPWQAESAESLHQFGYIVDVLDSTVYRAPGLETLASPLFFQDHCFRLVDGRDRAELGVEFTPTPARRRLADIRGTVWMERATARLRRIEFRYVNPENRDTEAGARGELDFARLPTGAWAVARWSIRMPILELVRPVSRLPGRPGGAESRVRVQAIKESGGELALVMAGTDTLYAMTPFSVRGVVADSATGRGVPGARVEVRGAAGYAPTDRDGRFAIERLMPGDYTLTVRTPSLDTLGTVSEQPVTIADARDPVRLRVPAARQLVALFCGAARARPDAEIPGIVVGRVTGPGGAPAPANTRVTVEWTDVSTGAARSAVVRADADGNFRICGVALHAPLTLRATGDTLGAAPVAVAVTAEVRMARVTLLLDRPAGASGVLTGTVVDSAGHPVPGAEVAFPALALSRPTDGRGAFRVPDVPAGTHRVLVRKLGYGALDTELEFGDAEVVERRVVLTRITELGEVRVVGAVRDRRMEEFEEHRQLGLGRFLTRDDIARQEGRRMSEVLRTIPGLAVHQPSGGRVDAAYVGTRRRCPYVNVEDQQECTCIASVYLDGMLMSQWEPVNINTFDPRLVEAVEYYAGRAQAPIQYNGPTNYCGVVVIHTRRDLTRR